LAELDLVAGDRRSSGVAGDLRIDLELLEHLGEPLDDFVRRLRARLVGAAFAQELRVRQRVDDVAKGQLFGPRGQGIGGRRHEFGDVFGRLVVGRLLAGLLRLDRRSHLIVGALDQRVLVRLVRQDGARVAPGRRSSDDLILSGPMQELLQTLRHRVQRRP
jgi:hypothetical protein